MSDWMGCTQLHRFDEIDGLLHLHTMPSVNICIKQTSSTKDYCEGRKEMFYLTTHSTHFIYGYMASDSEREETRCRHMGYSFRLIARVILYAPSHSQANTYHGLWYTSRRALAGTRNSSIGPLHEGSIRRPIAT